MTTAKHRERAREIAEATPFGCDDTIRPKFQRVLADEIAEALAATEGAAHAEGREEMREEAAKVADALEKSAAENANGNPQKGTTFEQWKDVQQFLHGKRHAADEIAAAIRALPKDTGK